MSTFLSLFGKEVSVLHDDGGWLAGGAGRYQEMCRQRVELAGDPRVTPLQGIEH